MLAVVALLTGLASASATTVSLTAAADTTIFSAYPDNNYGGSTLEIGANGVGQPGRALVRFDLSSIPAGSTITNATLSLTVVKIPPGDQHAPPTTSDFDAYLMLVPWIEGNGGGQMGSQGQLDEPTWDERGAQGVASWGSPGGQIGTDFANNSSTSASVGTGYGPLTWGSTPDFVADVQSWLDDPSTNYGYMLISDQESTAGTARRLASRESASGTDTAPTLRVDYIPADVPEPGMEMLFCAGILGVALCRRRPAISE
jgi:hypothetical protein